MKRLIIIIPFQEVQFYAVYGLRSYVQHVCNHHILLSLPVARFVGKHIGIQLYLDAYGLKPENVMAFGDGENDTEMLKIAGIGVAMGNAVDSLKAVADYVTDSVEDDGIMHALQHFGIIE